MSWNGGLVLLIVYGIYRLIRYMVNSLDVRKQCEADLLVANRRLAIKERRLAEIGEAHKNYKNIDVQTRVRLRTLVEERIERLDLIVEPGDLEAAVVRMYTTSQTKETEPNRGNG
jgi:hypothetical protein